MPKTLHADLAARSDADGVSLNQFIVTALARAVTGDQPAGAPDPSPARERVPRALRLALIANAVAVTLAAVTAIALLLFAWH